MPRIEGVKALAHQLYDWLINKFESEGAAEELAYVRARKLEASSSSFNFSQSVPLFEEAEPDAALDAPAVETSEPTAPRSRSPVRNLTSHINEPPIPRPKASKVRTPVPPSPRPRYVV